jgi:adenylylsulfate kinase-like enzyme
VCAAGSVAGAMTGPERKKRPEVVLMCGVDGAGKTTYAKRLEVGEHVRLSIDEEIWRRFGR